MAIEDLDLKKFKEYTRRERSCNDVCAHFGLNILEFSCVVNRLKASGINIIVSGVGEDATVLNLDERNLDGDNIYTIDIGDSTNFDTLIVSDPRLCSKYQQLSRLNFAYLEAWQNGFDKAILLGDITEGLYSLKSIYHKTLFADTTEKQVEYVINNYPYIEGMTTYFITGDQDATHTKTNGVDIGRMISEQREDMVYLGNMRCQLNIKKMKILAQHLKIGAFDRAKTISLKPQDAIYAMRSEEKVDIILDGHLLSSEQMTERGMREIAVPSLVATTPRIRSSAIPHNVGFVLLKTNLTKDGKFNDMEATFSPFYQTDQDDYTATKVLKIGGKK